MPLPCVSHSPAYHPRFSELSDEDLDILETVAWAISAGQPLPTSLTYANVQALLSFAACWFQMSKRQRRELVINQFVDLSGCATDDEIRKYLRDMKRFSTQDQREAALDFARYEGLVHQTC